MIPMTGDQISTLVRARDLLTIKLSEADPSAELMLVDALNGVLSVLKHTVIDVS